MTLQQQINQLILNNIKNNKLTKQQINTLINNLNDSLINLNNDLNYLKSFQNYNLGLLIDNINQ